ncbi:MAG: 16S rRNA (guanine(527)-N(7))-methyltransferase RsmG [Rhodobiaceae bacterium]|nr:16S rRNA (guanine(527)-N(7))-methyltransferase RsmG [Rhodobiaceae bacterium]
MTGRAELSSAMTADQFAARFSVSRETMARLRIYETLLERWQKVHNLVAPRTLPQIWGRHFADSAQLLALAPRARRWLDLGSGAGFPGLVLAILLADLPGAFVGLVESNQKKCAFLEAVRRETGAPARVFAMRCEELAKEPPGELDIVTARALAPLTDLFGLAAPFMAGHAQALFMKGRDVDVELTEASRCWKISADQCPSLTEAEGRILMVHSLRRR